MIMKATHIYGSAFVRIADRAPKRTRSPQHLFQPLRLFILCGLVATQALPALAADDAAQQVLGRKLFTQLSVPACALCHTLKAAEAEGAVGPVLDELKPTAARVAKALRDGIGQMPSYKGKLSDEQINALAAFVATATGAGN